MIWIKKRGIRKAILELHKKGELIVIVRLAIEHGVDFWVVAQICEELWNQNKIDCYVPRTTKGWEICQ